MKRKVFSSKDQLKKWAKKTTGVILTSLTLLGSAESIEFKFPTPKAISHIMETDPTVFPEGSYAISYSNVEELDSSNLDYSKMAMVVAFEAQLADKKTFIGGLRFLIEHLADFKYCCKINKTNPAYVTASIWVIEPSDMVEFKALEDILSKYSAFYAFNDGTGTLNLNNARMGKGSANHMFEV
ncbi:hypothetical protein CZ809_00779 [Photobacterium piscicola]|uniref:Uncharacterized protein n=1 Tax=Photobacterium piscicola TaxID=1378299 RepID=A0A1T5HWR8_9GAMM|nr:hypothetical protein [Photobacterium piscicola]SKC31301.1 hypothetical protein CZ809_00779 [Photobacterium piscicola]